MNYIKTIILLASTSFQGRNEDEFNDTDELEKHDNNELNESSIHNNVRNEDDFDKSIEKIK